MAFALVAAALLTLVAALAAVPVDLRFRSGTDPDAASWLRVEWLFGWLRRDVGRGERRVRTEAQSGSSWLRDLVRLWNAELQEALLALLGRLRRRVRVRELRVRGRIGLGDPADTGTAWAILAPVAEAAGSWPNVDLLLEPDFVEAGLRGELAGAVRVVPLELLPPLLAFAASPPVLRTLWALRERLGRRARAAFSCSSG